MYVCMYMYVYIYTIPVEYILYTHTHTHTHTYTHTHTHTCWTLHDQVERIKEIPVEVEKIVYTDQIVHKVFLLAHIRSS